jgi:hypothetical protein
MSTPAFFLGALLTGLLVGGMLLLLSRLLEPLTGVEARHRRLQRRRDARMARGTDLYFEELRSIEVGIEGNDKLRGLPRDIWRKRPNVYFLPPLLLFLGIWLFSRLSEPLGLGASPYWTHRLAWLTLAMCGLGQFMHQEPVFGTRRANWILGALFLAVSVLQLADAIPFYLNPQFVTE